MGMMIDDDGLLGHCAGLDAARLRSALLQNLVEWDWPWWIN